MCDKCSCDNPPPGYVPASLIPGGLVPDIPLIPSLVFRNIGVELSMRSDIRDQIQGIIDQKLHSIVLSTLGPGYKLLPAVFRDECLMTNMLPCVKVAVTIPYNYTASSKFSLLVDTIVIAVSSVLCGINITPPGPVIVAQPPAVHYTPPPTSMQQLLAKL